MFELPGRAAGAEPFAFDHLMPLTTYYGQVAQPWSPSFTGFEYKPDKTVRVPRRVKKPRRKR
jgi:hypothetical protein